jgi:hypothetical protein
MSEHRVHSTYVVLHYTRTGSAYRAFYRRVMGSYTRDHDAPGKQTTLLDLYQVKNLIPIF